MQALQSQSFVSSDSTAMDELHDFLRRRRQAAEPFDPTLTPARYMKAVTGYKSIICRIIGKLACM